MDTFLEGFLQPRSEGFVVAVKSYLCGSFLRHDVRAEFRDKKGRSISQTYLTFDVDTYTVYGRCEF